MKRHRFAAVAGAILLAALAGEATTLNFKSGAKVEGEVVEVKGTNVLVRSEKDGRVYTIALAYLTDEDRFVVTGQLPPHEDYGAAARAEQEKAEVAKTLPEQPENKADEGQIVGAFGLKLGQVFDLKYATKTNTFTSLTSVGGELVRLSVTHYGFRPRVPLAHFLHYSVEVTPRSNLVYSISATTDFLRVEPEFSVPDERDKLLSVLKQKYGPATTKPDDDNKYVRYRIKQDTREVVLSETELNDKTAYLHLDYTDDALQEQAKQEQVELDAADPVKKAERERLKKQL